MPRWDNTARKGMRAHIFHGSTPELFERWLRRASGHDGATRTPRSSSSTRGMSGPRVRTWSRTT